MSQASKQVNWCLKKAEKEIEECKRLGKRPKHRGLLKTSFNKEESESHLKKAEENLEFAVFLKPEEYGYKVIESLFYSMYHCFLAIASKFGYESGNQTCTIFLIEYLKEEGKINIEDKFIDIMKYKDEQHNPANFSIIDMRERYTYKAIISAPKNQMVPY